MKYILILATATCIVTAPYAKDMAVIPYKIDNPSNAFPVSHGEDYARMIGIAANALNGFSIYNPYQLSKDMSEMGIYPEKSLSIDNVKVLSNSRYIDFVVTGRLIKTEKGFRAESILFSADKQAVIAKSSVSAGTIYDLAEKDIKDLLKIFPVKKTEQLKSEMTTAVVLDSSYNSYYDWDEIKGSLRDYAGFYFNNYPGSTLYIIPYGDSIKRTDMLGPVSTATGIDVLLEKVQIKGKNSDKSFTEALRYAADNIRWEKSRANMIMIISNSPYTDTDFATRYAARASLKKIKMQAILLGKVIPEDSIRYSRLCEMTGGSSFDVTYRRIMYDGKGNDFYLYYERGRLYSGDKASSTWEKGLFTYQEKKRYGYAKGPQFADEQFYTGFKDRFSPYTMDAVYRKYGDKHVVDVKPLESNVRSVTVELAREFTGDNKAALRSRAIARALISDGKLSLWVDITDPDTLAYFQKNSGIGYAFYLGVRPILKKDEPYGVSFNPNAYITNLSGEHIPGLLVVKLSEILSKPKKFAESGMLTPPVWFIEIKINEINLLEQPDDIRGN